MTSPMLVWARSTVLHTPIQRNKAVLSNPSKVDEVAHTGYLVRFNNGATAFILSDPMDWPLSAIHRIMCVTKMKYNPNTPRLADPTSHFHQ